MKRSLLAIFFLLTILFTFSSLSFAQTGSGAFISPACSTITSPVSSNSWCFDSTNLILKVWNGSAWVQASLGAKSVPASVINCGSDGQIPIASSAGNPACATITAGSNVTVTNSNNGITIASTGGTSYTIQEHFSSFECLASCTPAPIAGPVMADRGVYNQQQINATTTSNTFSLGASVTSHPGVWTMTTGITAGNDGIFMGGTHAANTAAFPGVSTTIYTYQTSFQLGSVTTNGYFAVGIMDTTNNPGTASWLGGGQAQGIWCDVTNTTVAGNWACHSQFFSGGMQKTDLILSPVQTANTSWHTLKITAILSSGNNGTLTFFFDGTNVGTIGTNIYTGIMGPAWEAKLVSGTTAQTLNVDEWDFTQ